MDEEEFEEYWSKFLDSMGCFYDISEPEVFGCSKAKYLIKVQQSQEFIWAFQQFLETEIRRKK